MTRPHSLAVLVPTMAVACAGSGCSGSQNVSPDAAATVNGTDASPPPDASPPQPDAEAPAVAITINEVLKNPPGPDDDFEFIEVYGPPTTNLSNLWLVILEGDLGAPDTPGHVDLVLQVGTTDANGIWTSSFLAGAIDNGTSTVLLVEGLSGGGGAMGTDLDSDDDGILDTMPWISELDGLALVDDPGDLAYAAIALTNDADGVGDEFVGAARIPDGNTDGALGGWVRANDRGDGLQGLPGANGTTCASCGEMSAVSGQALLTPRLQNALAP